MNKNLVKKFSFVFIVLISVGFLLSSPALAIGQATATPTQFTGTNTKNDSPTFTPTTTITRTWTVTFTPLLSATPPQKSTESVSEPVQTEFATINNKLDNLKPNPLATHGTNIFDNLLSSVIVAAWTALVGFTKGILKFRNNQDQSATWGPNKTLINLETLLGDVFKTSLWVLFAFIAIWGIRYLSSSIGQQSSQSGLTIVSNKLDQIQKQLNTLSAVTSTAIPTSTPTVVPTAATFTNPNSQTSSNSIKGIGLSNQLVSAAILGVALFFFLILACLVSRSQAKFFDTTLPAVDSDTFNKKLLPAIFLIFTLHLLPDPIEAILLPVFIPYILFTFFDLILFYPNMHLKDIAAKHYPKIIFLAVFGVWWGVFHVLLDYLYPLWNVADTYLQSVLIVFLRTQAYINLASSPVSIEFWRQFPYMFFQFIWDLLAIILAVIFARVPSRQIQIVIKEKYIQKMTEKSKPGE